MRNAHIAGDILKSQPLGTLPCEAFFRCIEDQPPGFLRGSANLLGGRFSRRFANASAVCVCNAGHTGLHFGKSDIDKNVEYLLSFSQGW